MSKCNDSICEMHDMTERAANDYETASEFRSDESTHDMNVDDKIKVDLDACVKML